MSDQTLKQFKYSKKKFKKKFLVGFSDKLNCENWWTCNFFATWLRMLFFLNDVDILVII